MQSRQTVEMNTQSGSMEPCPPRPVQSERNQMRRSRSSTRIRITSVWCVMAGGLILTSCTTTPRILTDELPPRSFRLAQVMLLGFLLSLVLCGCEAVRDCSVTHKVWSNEEWRHFAGPAPSPQLTIFETANGDNILVQYDEMSDTSGRIRRRAYLLYPNLERIREGKRPDFVKPAQVNGAKLIQLQDSPMSTSDDAHPTPGIYAVLSRGGREFTLYRAGGREGPYELPDYLKSNNTAARVLLTPLAVAADSVMVGLVASVVAAYMLANGHYGGSVH